MPSLLEVRGLSKRFGGAVAVDKVDLSIEAGEVHGLIGPNGAGKSTLINLLTGIYRPDAGEICLDGRRIDRLPPFRIARLGLARTFQTIRLFHQLTALENLLAAQIPASRTGFLATILGTGASRRETAAQQERALALLELVGLAGERDSLAGQLPYGKQRLLEIARGLATGPRLLLLDEPAAGLNGAEIEALLPRLARIRSMNVTLLVIEHHMELIMNICHRVTVLEFGQRIAVGTPEQIKGDPAVIEAYLGRDEEEELNA